MKLGNDIGNQKVILTLMVTMKLWGRKKVILNLMVNPKL